MKIILARHCETDWNVQRRMQGHTDTELNDTGREQARKLGQLLSDKKIDWIYSSNLKRASQTAEIIATIVKAPVKLDERLREICFGRLEGLTLDEIRQVDRDPEAQTAERWDFRHFGGENGGDVLARHLSFLQYLGRQETRTALVIGHGSSFCAVQKHLGLTMGLRRGDYQVIEYENGRAQELEFFRDSQISRKE
ncbi:histidine phosphatase family protein [Patescibacteria group bacterium]|nr:MAG: histidine phosphatase family protein [Patescibacteria group bacterium]